MARFTSRRTEVMKRVRASVALAIDDTMAKCVVDARADHPPYPPASKPYERYANRTTFLTNSIALLDGARPVGPVRITGSWGAHAGTAVFLEIGTSRKESGAPRAQVRAERAGGDPALITPPEPVGHPQMAPRPFLRPAEERHYPLLALRCAAAFNGLELP